MALMGRLGIARKFALLGLMSLAAMAVVTYSLFASLDQVISFSQRELKGFELIGPIPRVVQTMQQHRGLSAGFLGGDKAMDADRNMMEKTVTGALRAMEAGLPPDLASGEALRRIKDDWARLREERLGLTVAESFAAHTGLIDRVQSFEVMIADEYALILDPEINTYYLIDTIVNKLPHVIEHLGQLRAFGTGILAGKHASPQQQAEISALMAKLDDAIADLNVNLDKATHHNPALRHRISGASGDFANAAQQVAGLVVSDIFGGRFATPPADFFKLFTAVIDKGYTQLHEALLPAAESLLKARIRRAQSTLYSSIGIAILLFLLVAYFAAGISRKVVGNIRQLVRSAQVVADGKLDERVYFETNDELDRIGNSFNQMAFGFGLLLEASRKNEARLQDMSAHLEERVNERTAELERAQHATQSLLSRYQALMHTSMDGIHIMDMRGNLVDANDAFCRMLGYTHEEAAQLKVTDWNAQWTEEEVLKQFDELAGTSAMFETLHRRKDGALIDVEISASGVEIEGQRFVIASSRDITLRKQAEAALKRHKVVIDTAIDGFWMTDMQGYLLEANEAYARMSGYAVGELVGMHISQLEALEQSQDVRAHIEKIMAQGHDRFETRHRRKDGQEIDIEISVTHMPELRQLFVFCRDITERKRAEEEIHNLAFYDVLTKLPNRRLFLDRFGAALIASVRHNNFGAVLFIDLDRFKLLNDTLGHDYGDLLLIEVAARIKSCVREMDTVARLGGDEFVVLIEGVSDDQEEASYKVGLVAEKIRETLARPYRLNEHEHLSSPSIGVSLYRGNEETVDELLQHADMAMYQAKDAGRNAVRFFDPVMQNNVAERATLVSDLRGAIAQRQLHLHYQLQVDNDNRPVGAEALLRWMHPQRGVVMPEQFLPVAEESALILDIGDWVLEQACRQLALWGENEKMRELVLTVNVSARQFALPDFADKIAGALRAHRIEPARLKLELTESMAIDDLAGAIEKMHALKALGISLSMDDLGTRYASLSSLKLLPLDQIKLGRNFVRDVANDGNVALLVQSIIDMSGRHHITVIAEGVENEAQLASLKDRDCVAYQGFLFSKAVPVEEFEKLLGL
ncbi:MAG: hypothetical protein A3F73_06460 [Gallionellales bacterium RIFCSPLOWO2_12_FULL_59_22]|nr:MAG: hypothetical protein A3H99_11345 [Gallionellales bacterium RIFCSPLOWO2_02_FULL_59_110]OGT13441.1 MAG: hypothetical protein A3F73_06460 [Gallionellales bacterium RIFCSPLOWO2_12_FULL_59_22]